MATNGIVNSITFLSPVAGQTIVQGQPIGGNLIFQLPNQLPSVNQLFAVESVNGNVVTIGFAASQTSPSFSQITGSLLLSQIGQSGASTGNSISWNGTAWVPVAALPGEGTVTSVALTAPAEFTVGGSPITGAGTLAITKATQLQNLVWASPNGSTGVPVFRALVVADIPSLPYDAAGAAATAQSNAEAFATAGDSTTLATAEAYVQTFTSGAHRFLISYNASTGLFTSAQPASTDLSDVALLAYLVSPAFSGTPTAPTATPLTNTTQIATTAYADAAVAVEAGNRATAVTAAIATAEAYVQNTPAVASEWINSYNSSTGAFTQTDVNFSDLIGSVTITQINSKRGNGGFVQLAASGTAGTAGDVVTFDANGNTVDSTVLLSSLALASNVVTSFNSRQGVVSPQSGDYSYSQISSTPQLAQTFTPVTNEFLTGYTAGTGLFTAAQPSFANIGGTATTAQLPIQGVGASVLSYDGGPSTLNHVVVFNAAGTTTDSGVDVTTLASQSFVTGQGYITSAGTATTISGSITESQVTGLVTDLAAKTVQYDGAGNPAAAGDNHIASGSGSLTSGTVTITLTGASAFLDAGYAVQVTRTSAVSGVGQLYAIVMSATQFSVNSSDVSDSTSTFFWTAIGI